MATTKSAQPIDRTKGMNGKGPTVEDMLQWMRRRSVQLRGEIDAMQHEAAQIRQRLDTLVVGVEQRRGAISEIERMIGELQSESIETIETEEQ